jgi:hypothetical protein
MKVWVLSTCIPDENEPCLPHVFASQAEADAALAQAMRDEWESNKPEDEETCEPLPFPDDPQEAHDRLSENPDWGQYEITAHEIDGHPLLKEALEAAREFHRTEPCAGNLPIYERFIAAIEKLEKLP